MLNQKADTIDPGIEYHRLGKPQPGSIKPVREAAS
jgi:hypothetical protein